MCFTAKNFAGCKFSMTAMGAITVVECFTVDMIRYNSRTCSIYLYYRYNYRSILYIYIIDTTRYARKL